jgi:hypothetical protein
MNKVNIPLDAFSYALSEYNNRFWRKFTSPHPNIPIQGIYFYIGLGVGVKFKLIATVRVAS